MDRNVLISRLKMETFHVPADQDYAISLFAPEDALGVARLTYSIYGDQHPFDYVYDPKEIARLFASGSQYALVAKSSRGDILGMIGLYRCAPWPHLYELAQLMILKNQRNKGMANDLWLRAMDMLPEVAKAKAIFGEAVCTHTFSQRMCQESKMIPCGLVMEAIPSRAYAACYQNNERTSLLLHTKLLYSDHQVISMPDGYREAFHAFCAKANMERIILDQQGACLAPTSTMEIIPFLHADCIKVWVHEAGRDLLKRVVDCERKAGDSGIVQVIFDLGNACALRGIEDAKSRGYFFGGFLPFWFGSDGLLLQRRNRVTSLSGMKFYNDESKYIIDLVETDMQNSSAQRKKWGEFS